MTPPAIGPAQFRELFPALRSTVWLDTPGAPLGARPVVDALHNTVSAWSSGEFDWTAWDAATSEARTLFARLVGVNPATVSTLGSFAEAAAMPPSPPPCRPAGSWCRPRSSAATCSRGSRGTR
jgi:selenocysteine lyase/cysteine desulfurase